MLATPSEHLRPLVRGECGDVRNVVEREVALLERGERAASSSTMPQRAARSALLRAAPSGSAGVCQFANGRDVDLSGNKGFILPADTTDV